ncbi:alpha-2-macroglobulin-like protein 1, partial [Kryptolebias marmoratus]|uniref:alpha-2-macroglobulin-like protein 1 n=1 Tax=Kryptolebias marmoratus TaxID=37003 RepID=UPI0018ACD0F3
MGHLWIQMWTLCAFLYGMYVGGAASSEDHTCPVHYLVSLPAVLEAGSKAVFCVSLSQPSHHVTLTVTLKAEESDKVLLRKGTSIGFHKCYLFMVPLVPKDEVQKFKVEVISHGFYSREVKKVLIKVLNPRTFIQTDKPIYNPGQTVQFRVVTLNSKLKPADGLYTIKIKMEQDPHNNKIGAWANETSSSRILQLSYSLNSEALEGFYRIVVQQGGEIFYHSFKVQKYDLPKFDIHVTISKEVSVGQNSFEVKACGMYKHGKPVKGDIKVRVCRPLKNYQSCTPALIQKNSKEISLTSLCKTKQKEADNKGCATFTFKMSSFTRIDSKALLDVLDVSATVDDKLSCVSHTQWERMKITYLIGRLSFVEIPKTYTHGTELVGKVKAVDYDGKPVPQLSLYLLCGERGYEVQAVTTNEDGVADFSINTHKLRGDVLVRVSHTPKLERREMKKIAFYEPAKFRVYASGLGRLSAGFLRILPYTSPLRCGEQEEITIEYSLRQQTNNPVQIVFLILSRGVIISQGHKDFHLTSPVNNGQFFITIRVKPDFTPYIQVVAYVVLRCDKVLAHSAKFPTEKCFKNPANAKFSPSPALPGGETKLCVKAEPISLCGVSLVELNVLKRSSGKILDADKILDLLPFKKTNSIPSELEDPLECMHVRPKRHAALAVTNQERNDAYAVFENAGMQLITNLEIQNPTCLRMNGKRYQQAFWLRKNKQKKQEKKILDLDDIPDPGRIPYTCFDEERLEPVHTLSTETWIFELVEVGEHGKTCVSYTVPETMNTWETEIYCLSPHSFGLAPRILLSVFRPFSLDFTLTSTLVLGESLILKAKVINHLQTCIKVKVTPSASSDFILTTQANDQFTFCLCAGKHKKIRWIFTPSVIGDVNVVLTAEAVPSQTPCCDQQVYVPEKGHIVVVKRSLTVKAVGIEIIKTQSWLFCPKGHHLRKRSFIQIPSNVIGGCLKAKVSVSGDIFSQRLKYLGQLLQLPYGCGEQNIALMAMNTDILHYLQNAHLLSEETRKKGSYLLTNGYQRQLIYKDKKGAFSTFGSGPGNTWLTAFGMITFYKAQAFIYIDPRIIEESRKWLECQQLKNGCFKVSGKLFNDKIRGGVPDELTLTAYVTAAFLEMETPTNNHVVQKSLYCLRESVNDFSNIYTTALLAYVYTLLGDTETRTTLLVHLDSVAKREGDLLYWCPTAENSSPLCVETTAYVMLAKLSSTLSASDLTCASSIVRWLIRQQNYHGGFVSTQDSAVALKALALYATLVPSPEGSSLVTVSSPSDHLLFHVNSENKQVYQEMMLQDLKGKYWLKAEGYACTSVQVSLHYNIPVLSVQSLFSVEVELVFHKHCHRPLVTLILKSLYKGDSSCTNMVILDILIPSGYGPVPESLWNLNNGVLVKNVEYKDGHVILYLWELHKDIPVYHELQLVLEDVVLHLKPSTVIIYDYYNPSDQGVTEYLACHSNCTKNCHVTKQIYPLSHKILNMNKRLYSRLGHHRNYHKRHHYRHKQHSHYNPNQHYKHDHDKNKHQHNLDHHHEHDHNYDVHHNDHYDHYDDDHHHNYDEQHQYHHDHYDNKHDHHIKHKHHHDYQHQHVHQHDHHDHHNHKHDDHDHHKHKHYHDHQRHHDHNHHHDHQHDSQDHYHHHHKDDH